MIIGGSFFRLLQAKKCCRRYDVINGATYNCLNVIIDDIKRLGVFSRPGVLPRLTIGLVVKYSIMHEGETHYKNTKILFIYGPVNGYYITP